MIPKKILTLLYFIHLFPSISCDFIIALQDNWEEYMSNLQIKSSSRRENSEKCLINIEENKTEIKQSTDVSKQKVAAFLIRAKEAEIISLASLQSRLSHIIQDQKNFEEQTVGKIDSFKTFASSLINDLKKVSFQVPYV